MACPTPVVLSANGNSDPISIPMKEEVFSGFGVAVLVNVSDGASLTATVQVTNDPNVTGNPSACRWNNHDSLQGLTGSKNSSIVFPIAAVRLVVSNYVSGSAQLQVGYADYTN